MWIILLVGGAVILLTASKKANGTIGPGTGSGIRATAQVNTLKGSGVYYGEPTGALKGRRIGDYIVKGDDPNGLPDVPADPETDTKVGDQHDPSPFNPAGYVEEAKEIIDEGKKIIDEGEEVYEEVKDLFGF